MGLLFGDNYISNYITKKYKYIVGVVDYNKKTRMAILVCPECYGKGETDQGCSSSDGWCSSWKRCETCKGKKVVQFKVPKEADKWKPKKKK